MIRRKLTLKRVDPWSVLKFGFVINLAVLAVVMLGLAILWSVITRLGLIERVCDSIGTLLLDLESCGVNGGNLFRTLLFIGLLSVIVQTGIMVFGAFLYNLIADLTGGLGFTFLDESGDLQMTTARKADAMVAGSPGTGSVTPPEPSRPVGAGPSGTAAGGAAAGSTRPGSEPSRPAGSTWNGPVGTPPRPAGTAPSGGSSDAAPASGQTPSGGQQAPQTRPSAAPPHRTDEPMFPRRDQP